MRKLKLSKTGHNKLRAHHKELKVSDLQDSVKSLPPGEWCILQGDSGTEGWIGFVNPMVDDRFAVVHALEQIKTESISEIDYIKGCIKKAYDKRLKFSGYQDGCRLFYGFADGLPGLIVDLFTNAIIIQINTAGVDRYRDLIKTYLSELTNKPAYFLDNPKYREKEMLPVFDNPPLPSLVVVENSLRFELRSEVIQKVGFYYDHRENRLQLQRLLERLKHKPRLGVDLFCYVGAWGMNALHSGLESIEFVDQGDFGQEINRAIELNGLKSGQFTRSDVFQFLDQAHSKGKKFDLVLCDPPAFAKSAGQKHQAIEGYSKLHRKVMRVASAGAICAFSSCTHYVSHEEFQKNILDAAYKENRKIHLLHVGMQGWDHPVTSLEDRANYIKSYFYMLE